MNRYYTAITDQMRAEIEGISALMSHPGERGRNNELILAEFLKRHLPTRYGVTTGKVVDTKGNTSTQTDIIINDRLNFPGLVEAKAWTLVPIETTFAVISVKSKLWKKNDLDNACEQIESVRRLHHVRQKSVTNGRRIDEDGNYLIRPRSYVFSFGSIWKQVNTVEENFRKSLEEIDDSYRPIALCVMDQCFIRRTPYELELHTYTEHSFLTFFMFLLHAIDTFPRAQMRLNLAAYFPQYSN